LVAWAGAEVCTQGYHLQAAYQVLLTGKSSSSMVPGLPLKLDKAMSKATLLHDSTEYKMITDWDKGPCDVWTNREVTFATRKKAAKSFTAITTSEYYVKSNVGEFQTKKPGWDEYWYGFASKVDKNSIMLYDAVGKFKNATQLVSWYGNATMKRTYRNVTGSIDSTFTHYYPELTSHPDSAALIKVLLDTDNWKAFIPVAGKLDIDFQVQLIKIQYDSLPTPISGIAVGKAKASGFQVSQTGNLVLIKAGEKAAGTEPLSLYGMMGNKIATLHPTGYFYQWNGKTSFGADAPTGVYFVQSGNRILGKFFYSR
jgi:hypothetical protein